MFRRRGWSKMLSNTVYVSIITAFVPVISGLVQEDSATEEDVTVSFAELGKGTGSLRWPKGKDIWCPGRVLLR